MPNLTQPLDTVVAQERDSIINKATLRTELFREKYFLTTPDTRNPKVLAYEEQHFNNPKSELYGDLKAATLWATFAGIPDAKFVRFQENPVEVVRAVVLVPVNHLQFEWYKELPLVPMICVHQRRLAFRTATGEKFHLANPTNKNVRPATSDEIAAVVDGLLAVRKMSTIKNLGDSFVGIDLGTDEDS